MAFLPLQYVFQGFHWLGNVHPAPEYELAAMGEGGQAHSTPGQSGLSWRRAPAGILCRSADIGEQSLLLWCSGSHPNGGKWAACLSRLHILTVDDDRLAMELP